MIELNLDSNFKLTEDGFLDAYAYVSRLGVLEYPEHKGFQNRQVRLDEHVFNKKSLDSLKSLPITFEHPKDFVNSSNSKNYLVGFVTNDITITSDKRIKVGIRITDSKTIDSINNGKIFLSLGYKTNLIQSDGLYNNEQYTSIQTDIIYNHLAITSYPRGGGSLHLSKDSNYRSNKMIFNYDSYSVDVEEKTLPILEKMKSDIEILKSKNSDSEKTLGKFDTLKLEHENLKIKLEENKNINIDSLVQNRIKLINKAQNIITDSKFDFTGKSDSEIIIEAIKSKDINFNFDSIKHSKDYLLGRFESIETNEVPKTSKLIEVMNSDSKAKNNIYIPEMNWYKTEVK